MWEGHSSDSSVHKVRTNLMTVADLTRCLHVMPQPSQLLRSRGLARWTSSTLQGSEVQSVRFSAEGSQPLYEDTANSKGGHYEVQLKSKQVTPEEADEVWKRVALHTMLGRLQPAHILTAVCLVDKMSGKQKITDCVRIEVWHASKATAEEISMLQKSIGACSANRACNPGHKMIYRRHAGKAKPLSDGSGASCG
eukprot:TRINITY_DN110672_c0_g1_i1.p2 TRINITY_DN110672_c0_g1~~TRINITY_DN110672_c0_g1_i1.p2  ORF type:complete len:195 (-),score=24.38 TRINITY_DN110672_c0_g1_i1:375-959(-)